MKSPLEMEERHLACLGRQAAGLSISAFVITAGRKPTGQHSLDVNLPKG